MRLYVGRNHEGDSVPVRSIFRLAGNGEDALTFALGLLLASDAGFSAKLVRSLRVAPRKTFDSSYSVYLQEVTDPAFGRRDVVLEGSGMRIVLEAKIGGAEPTAEQLLKYGDELRQWTEYPTRAVVALTQTVLPAGTRNQVSLKLSEHNIQFANVQWHEIIELVLHHRPSGEDGVSHYLFDEFASFITKDYKMGYYDAEVLVQDVNPLNAEIFEKGWMYVTSLRDKRAPLYFAPYFTKQGGGSGISRISRVRDYEIAVLEQKTEIVEYTPSDEHGERWSFGLEMLRKRAKKEGFADGEVRLFYLDRPITIATAPLTKKEYNATSPPKRIPSMIPKGFSLGFDELLEYLQSPRQSSLSATTLAQ